MNRTLAKTCTYSLMHLTVAIIVAYALTRDWRIALAVGLVEPIVQTFAFAIHERLWSRQGPRPSWLAGCGHAHAVPAAQGEDFRSDRLGRSGAA